MAKKKAGIGKAANNERIKIRATYYNNVSVGLLVAGSFVPYFSLFYLVAKNKDWLWTDISSYSTDDVRTVISGVVAIITAMILSIIFRVRADVEIQKIKD